MKVNFNDPSVPDYAVVDIDDLVESFSYTGRASVRKAIEIHALPPQMDNLGKDGKSRWTVGMIREWNTYKASLKMEEAKKALFIALKPTLTGV